MKIDLETVRSLLRRTLGFNSFTAGFVSSVRQDKNIPTACINTKGVMRYNPGFVRNKVLTEADLFCLIFHELLHPAFGHFIYKQDELTNIACDAIINSVISNLFMHQSSKGILFTRLYPERGMDAILRPGSKLRYSRYHRLYEYLYPRYCSSNTRLSAGEVIQTLKALTPTCDKKILLIGSHGNAGEEGNNEGSLPDKIAQEIARDILTAIKDFEKSAGYCDALENLIIEVLRPKKTIRQDLLLGYATRKKLDAFFDTDQRQRRITSPFPINPSRRDMVLLSAGVWPGLFRNRQPEVIRRQKGIALFLDVSGSVNDYLPEIIGILSGLRNRIKTIYLFSDRVVEVPFESLCKGKVETTFGTDFDCIAKEILEKKYERAVVITDGYASLSESKAVLLKKFKVRILTILFDGGEECEDLVPFGEVMQLEELIS